MVLAPQTYGEASARGPLRRGFSWSMLHRAEAARAS